MLATTLRATLVDDTWSRTASIRIFSLDPGPRSATDAVIGRPVCQRRIDQIIGRPIDEGSLGAVRKRRLSRSSVVDETAELDAALAGGDHTVAQEWRQHRAVGKAGVSYLDTGGALRPAVFIHGLGTSSLLWRHVLPEISDRRRCVAVDLPFHGGTRASPGQVFSLPALADLVVAWCDELGLEEFDLVGNDTGGAIAQVVAARYGDRVATLTLTNCDVYDNIPTQAFWPTYLLARAGLLAPAMAKALHHLPAARRRAYGAGYENVQAALPLPVARAWLAPLVGTPERARAFQQAILSIRAADLVAVEPELSRLNTTTHLVWGTGDRFFPLRWAHRLQSTIPGVQSLDRVAGGRLFFPDERGHELAGILQRNWSNAQTADASQRLG